MLFLVVVARVPQKKDRWWDSPTGGLTLVARPLYPAAFSLPLLDSTVEENQVKKFLGQDKTREIP